MSGPVQHSQYRFCPACGRMLELRQLRPHEPRRLVCSGCAGIIYFDPKVVACVIVEIGDKILLMRRNQDESGRWLLPGGYVDEGEQVERAAIREVWEEVGLRIELKSLVGVFSYPDWPPVVIVYFAHLDQGTPQAGEETASLALFAPQDIPWAGLTFPSTRDALITHLQGRTCQPNPLAVCSPAVSSNPCEGIYGPSISFFASDH